MNANAFLTVLLRDFGYCVRGDAIVQAGVRGFTADRVWGRCRGLLDAAEQLCPIIADPEFSRRLAEVHKLATV